MQLRIRDTNVIVPFVMLALVACSSGQSDDRMAAVLDVELMLQDLERLSHDSLEGRKTGSSGNQQTRHYIANEFAQAGLLAYSDTYEQPFEIVSNGDSIVGVNVVGGVSGSGSSERIIVVSAHFDHLGIRDGSIFNGADDNASGTAALLALARYISANPLEHTVIFLAVDAEEMGLQGARAFVANPPVAQEHLAIDVNMDMISHSDSVLFVAGTYHYPALLEPLQTVAARSTVALRFGHDTPGLPSGDDWTNSSDHGPFHAAGIPFVYFGVEDHPDYHQPSDDFDTINPVFFAGAVETILDAVKELDANIDALPR